MIARSIPSPFGPLTLSEAEGALVSVDWRGGANGESALLLESEAQFTAYFAGDLERFDLPWRVEKSEAQARACAAMTAIPRGETRTYGELAKVLGVSAQAMGQLCGGNPLPILVPCHRVLGTQGLGGFSAPGGVETKVQLLRLEGAGGFLL
jgi:methylated-DNA-[protein]-cysteine S-methyltransferase